MSPSFQAFGDELAKIASQRKFKRLQEYMKPGDIILATRGLKRPDGVIDRVALGVGERIGEKFGDRFHHAAVYSGNGNMVDMQLTGLEERPLEHLGNASAKVYRPKLNMKDRKKAVERLRGMEGKKYNAHSAVKLWLSREFDTKGDRREAAKELNCTSAVAEAYRGKLDLGRQAAIVGPWDIAGSKDVKQIASMRGKY